MNPESDEESFHPALERMLTDLDELLRLRRRTKDGANAASGAAARRFSGFSTFIDAVLPKSEDAERRIARAIRLDEETLRQFRRREVGPADLPADSLATLGRSASLEWATFDALVTRDLTWFVEESPLAMLRENSADPAEVRRLLRAAWERDALDDAGALDDE